MERIIVDNKDVYKVILKAVKPSKTIFGKLFSSTVSAEEASKVTSLYFKNCLNRFEFLSEQPTLNELVISGNPIKTIAQLKTIRN